jgi:hypothetical protein
MRWALDPEAVPAPEPGKPGQNLYPCRLGECGVEMADPKKQSLIEMSLKQCQCFYQLRQKPQGLFLTNFIKGGFPN